MAASLRTRLIPCLVVLAIVTYMAFCAFLFLLLALAQDILTIPYLTPLAHFLGAAIYPLMPAWGAIFLGASIKVYKYKKDDFPGRRSFLFVCWTQAIQLLKHAPMWIANVVALFDSEIIGEPFCEPLQQGCRYTWVELGLLIFVVGGEYLGLRWDLGRVQRVVDAIAADEVRTKRKSEEEKMIQKLTDAIESQEVKGEDRIVFSIGVLMEELNKTGSMEKGALQVEDGVEEYKDVEAQTVEEM
jgi:hypothetical protein